MAVTLKDIAERVGKSVPTVSRALGGYEDISQETRREVVRVAREMGYEPHLGARSLQQQRTSTFSLILPVTRNLRFTDPFFSEFLSGLVQEAGRHDYSINLSTDQQADERTTYLRQIRGRRADGYVVVRLQRQDARITLLQEQNVPFVAFGRTDGPNDFPLVDVDDTAGMRRMVDHLVALGHRRLGCIAEPTRFTKGYLRLQGFRSGLMAHHLTVDEELIVETNFRERSGREGAERLLDHPQPPTAILACNDLLAVGAMQVAHERGIEIGRELSITGFDNIPLAANAHPPLTTVDLPAHHLGTQVAKMLHQLVTDTPPASRQVILTPTLIKRASSGPVAPP